MKLNGKFTPAKVLEKFQIMEESWDSNSADLPLRTRLSLSLDSAIHG
jgi:hypothetical protein